MKKSTPKKALTYGEPAPRVDGRSRIDAKGWVESGRWVRVKSSNVAGISYDVKVKQLLVEFNSGGVYAYKDVPEVAARDMFNCSSIRDVTDDERAFGC